MDVRTLAFVFLGGLAGAVSLVSGCGLEQAGDADLFGGGDDGGLPGFRDSGTSITLDGTMPASDANGGGGDSSSNDVTSNGDTGDDDDDGPTNDVALPDVGPDACGPTEICNDGVDNDCNGKTDCADPACGPAQGWKCVPPVPSGWTQVEYAQNARNACSSGYGSPAPVVEGPAGGNAPCGCTCSVTDPGSCTAGNFSGGIDPVVGPACSLPFQLAANGGNCTKFAVSWTTQGGSKAQVTPAPWTGPGACTTTAQGTTPPAITYAGQGQTCALNEPEGAGCPGSGVCAPSGAGYAICIEQTGDNPCPGGYGTKHLVGPSANDTRSCSACSCTVSAGCQNEQETVFTDSSCATGGSNVATQLNMDGKCDGVSGGNQTYTAYTYTASVKNPQCATQGGQATGSVTLAPPVSTVCCAN
jgi:hypothetical protein